MTASTPVERFDIGARLSEMAVYNGVAYLAGQVPEDASADITGQTAQVLSAIDKLLERAGTDKTTVPLPDLRMVVRSDEADHPIRIDGEGRIDLPLLPEAEAKTADLATNAGKGKLAIRGSIELTTPPEQLTMGALLAVSASAFLVVKIVGAGYLVYLGIKQWRSTPLRLDASASTNQPTTPGRLFLQGLGVAVTNPKAILFFTALFPQFLAPGESLVLQTVLLTATFTALALLSHAVYVGLFRTLRRFLTEAKHLRLFNRISGGLFVLLGLSLLKLRNRAA